MANGNHMTQWLVGILCAVGLSLLSYIWVDREGRLADLERRVEIREQEWHKARYALQDRIHAMEYDIKTLQARWPQESR